MEDYDDPRIEISSGAKLIVIWEQMGLGEEYRRQQLGESYDPAIKALAKYRRLKAQEALAVSRLRKSSVSGPVQNLPSILKVFQSNLSDGGKVAALAVILTGCRTARDVAEITNRSLRSTERHYAEARKYADVREYADVRRDEAYAGTSEPTGESDEAMLGMAGQS
jgi:hypothetical protein